MTVRISDADPSGGKQLFSASPKVSFPVWHSSQSPRWTNLPRIFMLSPSTLGRAQSDAAWIPSGYRPRSLPPKNWQASMKTHASLLLLKFSAGFTFDRSFWSSKIPSVPPPAAACCWPRWGRCQPNWSARHLPVQPFQRAGRVGLARCAAGKPR